MTEEQTPTGVQDPAPVSTPAPVAAPPAPGPWDTDLQAMFADEAVRGQVDQYLRTKIQPRMTQLEQTAAGSAQAQTLMNDLISDPQGTMEALAAELNWTPQQVAEAVEQTLTEPEAQPELDPRVQALIDAENQRQNLSAYESEMARVVAANPGLDPDDLHPFVVTAEGNFDQAVALRNAYVDRWNAKHTPAEPVTPAPPTLGGDAGNTTPELAPKKLTLHEAVDKFMRDNQPSDPPPIS